jgi:hypothetical protein
MTRPISPDRYKLTLRHDDKKLSGSIAGRVQKYQTN